MLSGSDCHYPERSPFYNRLVRLYEHASNSRSSIAYRAGILQCHRYPLLQGRRIQVDLKLRHLVEPSIHRQLCREEAHSEPWDGDILVLRVALRAVRDGCSQVDLVADDVW